MKMYPHPVFCLIHTYWKCTVYIYISLSRNSSGSIKHIIKTSLGIINTYTETSKSNQIHNFVCNNCLQFILQKILNSSGEIKKHKFNEILNISVTYV